MTGEGEWVWHVGYLVPAHRVQVEVHQFSQRTTWHHAEDVSLSPSWTLTTYVPGDGAPGAMPPELPDWKLVAVDADRFADHVAEHLGLKWHMGSAEPSEEGAFHIVSWRSKAMTDVLAEAERQRASVNTAPAPPPVYSPPSYARQPATPTHRTGSGAIQSGMRAGALAGFVDGITGGGFFDF